MVYVDEMTEETTWNFLLIAKTVCIATIGLAACYVVSFLLYVRRMEKAFKGVKRIEKFHWLFGHLPTLPSDGHDRTNFIIEMVNKYGKEDGYMMLWGSFRKPMIIPCSAEVAATICKSNEPKAVGRSGAYRLLLPWLGEGLLIANGSRWGRNRRLLTPAFHFEILKPYMKVFNKSADILVEKLSVNATKGQRFEVFQTVCLCTLEIILKCAFSYDKDVQTLGDRNPYVQAVYRLTDTLFYRFIRPIYHYDFIWYLTPTGRQFKKDCDYVHSVAEEIIEKRKQTLAKESSAGVKDRRYIDFLDILLTARDDDDQGLTRMEIRQEVDTFLFEGHDTTASAISWILYSLAQHPEWQKKCQDEIDHLLEGRESDYLEWSDLSQLDCLTMCIKEGMRLHSPVPILNRETKEEFRVGDRVFPKGIIVQINIWVLNHMESMWGKDHMVFKPERFSKDNIAKMPAFQFVPFSAGPRNCIGQNFAMNEEKVVLSKLLRNFTFTVDKSHTVRRNIAAVMRSQDGIYLFAEKRDLDI